MRNNLNGWDFNCGKHIVDVIKIYGTFLVLSLGLGKPVFKDLSPFNFPQTMI